MENPQRSVWAEITNNFPQVADGEDQLQADGNESTVPSLKGSPRVVVSC